MPKFQPGQSGNTAGRPRQPKNDSTTIRNLIGQELPIIIASLITAAKNGDIAAAKILVDKSLPSVRPVSLATPLPALAAAQSLSEKADVILDSLASGDIGSDTAMAIMNSLGKAREISASNAPQIDTEFNVHIIDAATYLDELKNEQSVLSDSF